MPFIVETDAWPTLVLRPVGVCETNEWVAGWDEVSRVLKEREGVFALLADAREASVPTAVQRSVVGDFFRRHDALLKRRCRGLAVVVENPVIKAAATAVFWISRPAAPMRFERDLATAQAWITAQLDDDAQSAVG